MQEESLGPDVFSSGLLLVDRVAASVPGSCFGRENKSEVGRFIRRKSVDASSGIPYRLDMETGHGAPGPEGSRITMDIYIGNGYKVQVMSFERVCWFVLVRDGIDGGTWYKYGDCSPL